jgi:hypothetical protein
VHAGRIRLPKFQREFVWTREQVLDLLDSIARNYPIGSLLLWQSPLDLASERNIAGLEVETYEGRDDTIYPPGRLPAAVNDLRRVLLDAGR